MLLLINVSVDSKALLCHLEKNCSFYNLHKNSIVGSARIFRKHYTVMIPKMDRYLDYRNHWQSRIILGTVQLYV